MPGNFSCLCCSLLTFFKIKFFSKILSETISMSNGLDPDQDTHSVGPDLVPNCFQRRSADDNQKTNIPGPVINISPINLSSCIDKHALLFCLAWP